MVRLFRSDHVAGFDVGEGQGEEQNPDPENYEVHCRSSLSVFADSKRRAVATLAAAIEALFKGRYGPDRHKGSRREG
jgi:hypothetical protein